MHVNSSNILLAAIEHRGLMGIQRALKKANDGIALQLVHTIPALAEYLNAHETGPAVDPQLVIVDLSIPSHFGIEVLRRIRSWSDKGKCLGPAAIVSDRDLPLALDAYEAGAVAVISSPINDSEFRDLIRRFNKVASHGVTYRSHLFAAPPAARPPEMPPPSASFGVSPS